MSIPLSVYPPQELTYGSSDESDALLPSSQDSHSTSISEQEARQDVYQIIPRANESPDELAQDVSLTLIREHSLIVV